MGNKIAPKEYFANDRLSCNRGLKSEVQHLSRMAQQIGSADRLKNSVQQSIGR